MERLEGLAGAVTAVTGFEKGSGKTTFLGLALPFARVSGPVALFTIGVDGAQKAREGNAPPGEIAVEPGDLVLTAEGFARASSARFEILDALPGRTALGPLLLGRARRPGTVTLVGAEHLSLLARAIAQVREEGWASTVLVDGAVNRITQVGALGDLQFVFTARVDPRNLDRAAGRMRALAALAELPLAGEEDRDALALEGPLTAQALQDLPRNVRSLRVEDFTRIFLEPPELRRTLERYRVSVRRACRLLGFHVSLRGLSRDRLVDALGPLAAPRLLPDLVAVAP
jgi:hypothetical protein